MRFLIRAWMLFWTLPYVLAWLLFFVIACIGFGPFALVHLYQGGPVLAEAWGEPWKR